MNGGIAVSFLAHAANNGHYYGLNVSIIISKSMSLLRKGSKTTLRMTTEDFSSCLDQKNSIIASLQAEVEALRANQERYDRAKE